MAEKKKRRGRRAHLEDFYRDAAGRYVYRGAHYVCEAGEAAQAALRRRLWPLAIAAAAAVLAGGCISAPGVGRCPYVMLPYAAQVGVLGSVLWAMARWQAREYPLREYVYRATVRALPGRCLAGAVLAGAGIAAEAVYLLAMGSGGRGLAAAGYLCLQGIALLGAVAMRRGLRACIWKIVGKENG